MYSYRKKVFTTLATILKRVLRYGDTVSNVIFLFLHLSCFLFLSVIVHFFLGIDNPTSEISAPINSYSFDYSLYSVWKQLHIYMHCSNCVIISAATATHCTSKFDTIIHVAVVVLRS